MKDKKEMQDMNDKKELHDMQAIATGFSQLSKSMSDLASMIGTMITDANQTKSDVKDLSNKVDMLAQETTISAREQYELKTVVDIKVDSILDQYGDHSKSAKRAAYSKVWNQFKRYFGLPRYYLLPRVRMDDAKRFIRDEIYISGSDLIK